MSNMVLCIPSPAEGTARAYLLVSRNIQWWYYDLYGGCSSCILLWSYLLIHYTTPSIDISYRRWWSNSCACTSACSSVCSSQQPKRRLSQCDSNVQPHTTSTTVDTNDGIDTSSRMVWNPDAPPSSISCLLIPFLWQRGMCYDISQQAIARQISSMPLGCSRKLVSSSLTSRDDVDRVVRRCSSRLSSEVGSCGFVRDKQSNVSVELMHVLARVCV